jgi:hypothetical protein
MWVKKLSDYSDSMVAKKLGIDRRTVSKYRKMSEEDFNSFVSKGRVYTRILSSYYSPDFVIASPKNLHQRVWRFSDALPSTLSECIHPCSEVA